MLCFVAVLVIEYIGFRKRKREYRELEHFAEFLSNLKDQFYLCRSVTESIFRAAEQMPGSLRKRLEKICFLLEEDVAEAVFPEEMAEGHMKYMRLFWIQCRSAVQYGSGKNSAESVFVKNMTELRRDVQNECYQRAQAMYLFAGMGVVAVTPIIFLPMIRWFGRITMEELQSFYEGKAGAFVVGAFFLLTACSYSLVYLVRQPDKRLYRRPKWLQRVLSFEGLQKLEAYFAGSKLEQYGAMQSKRAGIEANGMQYWGACGISGVVISVMTWYLIHGEKGWEALVVLLGGFLCGWMLGGGFYKYLGYLRRLGRGGEVLSLQAVVLLLIEVPNITLMELLDVLGVCGELFKKVLLRCGDSYVSEDVKALEDMVLEEEYPAFRQFAGRILVSERIGLRAAFAEVASDRSFFREQLRLDSEQEQKKKAANAQVVAFLPMMFLLFGYLILPFLGASIAQMRDIFREMEQIRYF